MRRHLDESLQLRLPGFSRLLARGFASLAPGSPIRRRLLKRFVRRGYEAFSRGDAEAALIAMHPEVDIHLIGENLLGMPPRYHGHEGGRMWMRGWRDLWGDYEEVPEQVIDLGDVVIVRSKISTRGERSGVETSTTVGNCYYLTDGRITRWEMYLAWSDLAEARGLDAVAQQPATSAQA